MTARRATTIVSIATLAVAAWYVLFIGLPRWTAPKPRALPPPEAHTQPAAKIRARLYYLAEDGLLLQFVETEVAFGNGTVEQGRQLVLALLNPPPSPLVSTIPQGTTLKGFYLSGQGVAFVDLSAEATTAHRGGSLDEIFTVYSIVNTLTENLPAITAVQLLVNGRQVDTLAGHVDIRRPLTKDLRWTELPRGTETRSASGATPVAPPQE